MNEPTKTAPICPKCGNNRQVWPNQITGKMTCHRAYCHTEIEPTKTALQMGHVTPATGTKITMDEARLIAIKATMAAEQRREEYAKSEAERSNADCCNHAQELAEAREIIRLIGTTHCGCNYIATYRKAQAWLERNKEGEG